jgi:hypothetical protein
MQGGKRTFSCSGSSRFLGFVDAAMYQPRAENVDGRHGFLLPNDVVILQLRFGGLFVESFRVQGVSRSLAKFSFNSLFYFRCLFSVSVDLL